MNYVKSKDNEEKTFYLSFYIFCPIFYKVLDQQCYVWWGGGFEVAGKNQQLSPSKPKI